MVRTIAIVFLLLTFEFGHSFRLALRGLPYLFVLLVLSGKLLEFISVRFALVLSFVLFILLWCAQVFFDF